MMDNITIESERLLFQRLSLEHVSTDYLNWLNDPEVNKFLEVTSGNTLESLESFVKSSYSDEIYFWAILVKATNKHIGNIKIDPIDFKLNSGEYGIMMGDRSQWGQGYAKEASRRIIRYCFNQLGLEKITLGVVASNLTAVKLYENLGFVLEKVIKESGTYDGKLCNSFRMVLKIEDFGQ